MHPYYRYGHRGRTLDQYRIDELVETLSELLDVRELRCVGTDELFPETREALSRARIVRSAVLDELAPLEEVL
jgi:hypothetical protein